MSIEFNGKAASKGDHVGYMGRKGDDVYEMTIEITGDDATDAATIGRMTEKVHNMWTQLGIVVSSVVGPLAPPPIC